jgi:predicted RNase H-like HicB family nuclease
MPPGLICGHLGYVRFTIFSMDMVFTAVYEEVPEAEGGGYSAYTEELPGAISEGDTLDEARANLCDAVQLLLLTRREDAQGDQAGNERTKEKGKAS